MTSDWKHTLGAFALPEVLVVSVLVLLLVMPAYSAVTLNIQRYSLYHERKQLREDLKSALVLYCADSTLCAAGDSVEVELFSDSDVVEVSVEPFGLYEKVTFSNGYPDSYRVFVGRRSECGAAAAFWLCDRNRALSLAGDAEIDGQVYMPLNGINYTQVDGRYYSGEPVPESSLRIAPAALPPVDSAQFIRAAEMCRMSRGRAELSRCVRDTVVCGSVVKIKPGFRGSLQVFASDSVTVGEGAVLEYPSGIYVGSGNGRPFVLLEKGAQVNGYVIVTSRNSDSQLRFPSYVQKNSAELNGLLYVDGSCNLEGNIRGAAYVKDCYYFSGGNIYAGTVNDARIARSDSLAFPIFLQGPYERKYIKKLSI